MRTVNYDALATSVPLNRSAAVVRDGRSMDVATVTERPPGYVCSDLPLPTREPKSESTAAGWRDLRGVRFGRMVVVGMSATVAKRWVVRCSCGRYELRKSATIKDLDRPEAQGMCFECGHVEKLKAEAREIAAGRGRDTEWAKELKRRRGEAVTAILESALALTDALKQFDGDPSKCPAHVARLSKACADYRAAKSPT